MFSVFLYTTYYAQCGVRRAVSKEYLKGKDWSERYRVGLLALNLFGILKP